MSKIKRLLFSIPVCLIGCFFSFILYMWSYNIFLRKVYPIKYTDVVNTVSKKYNIEPELIYAVIKIESDFIVDAESGAGAKGLMQITDDTFEWLQLYRGSPGMDTVFLMNPEVNIDYGTMFICMLRKKYNDDTLVLSAYNAGINAVEKWLKDERFSDNGKELKFIPYSETSEYVRKIKQTKAIYRELYFE